MVVCVNMNKLTLGEAPLKRLNSQLISLRLTKNCFRNPTSNLNLVISLSPMASNRLNKLSGCGLSIPLGPLALLYGQTDRRTDGRCYHKPIRHPRHSGPGRAGSSSMAKVSLSYTESNQPMWDFLKSARRRRSVCVCPVSGAVSWSLRRVASSAHVTFLLFAELADDSCEATDARSRFGFTFSTGAHLLG